MTDDPRAPRSATGAESLFGGPPPRIEADDIEAKFRELAGDVDEIGQEIKSVAVTVAVVGIVALAAVAFYFGRRRGRRSGTIVEIRRV